MEEIENQIYDGNESLLGCEVPHLKNCGKLEGNKERLDFKSLLEDEEDFFQHGNETKNIKITQKY